MINVKRIAVLSLYVVILLLSSMLFYITSQIADPTQKLKTYNTRREDIYNSQQKLEQLLFDLNVSIQKEIDYQSVLTEKVVELSEKEDVPPPIINTTRVVQPPSVVQTIPQPVTRAS